MRINPKLLAKPLVKIKLILKKRPIESVAWRPSIKENTIPHIKPKESPLTNKTSGENWIGSSAKASNEKIPTVKRVNKENILLDLTIELTHVTPINFAVVYPSIWEIINNTFKEIPNNDISENCIALIGFLIRYIAEYVIKLAIANRKLATHLFYIHNLLFSAYI